MIWQLDIALLFLIVVVAVAAITLRDLLSAIMLLSAYSFLMAVVWVEMHSVDVAFTEAAVGAGATTAFLIAALWRGRRRGRGSGRRLGGGYCPSGDGAAFLPEGAEVLLYREEGGEVVGLPLRTCQKVYGGGA
ncbi:hypothetical protein B6V00_01815 [ANME-1 cluster archaeon ex4572_4]|nr:MAG: hypothetical protein B6V00_01815 [ANME-1 cluster archaeon ex4572_4]